MTDYKTPYGVVHWNPTFCKDDWANIRLYDQPPAGGSPIKLQASALRAFKNAEERYGKATKRPSGWRAIGLTGSWRSCAYQLSLWTKDPKRYAKNSGHPQGLCIDVSTLVANQATIRKCLLAEGWKQSRPDESWHYSYWVSI